MFEIWPFASQVALVTVDADRPVTLVPDTVPENVPASPKLFE